MKKEYNKTKKQVIGGLVVVAVCLALGLCWYLGKIGNAVAPEEAISETVIKQDEVVVPEITVQKETEPQKPEPEKGEISKTEDKKTDESTEQSETKEEAKKPDKKPDIIDEYSATNTEEPPQYEQDQSGLVETKPQEPAGGTANENGQVYVPGFGYVDDPGAPVGDTAGSDGDWNKQIGNMN